jgi:hypothetical protein
VSARLVSLADAADLRCGDCKVGRSARFLGGVVVSWWEHGSMDGPPCDSGRYRDKVERENTGLGGKTTSEWRTR